ncbi:aminoglycoside phosphotransferase family protein [Paenochrobactrum sp. BZR 588]|uniref:aminoglycoside phosphotransferase family protein n=1 Tax=unclassified Paenochrobactrum TaxID=2639760 RepID=UPI003854991D
MIIPAFPQDWAILEHELLNETFSSFIWKVRLLNDEIAIVKEIKIFDDDEDELRGFHYLKWHNGGACVRLLDFQGRQMLLEYASDKTLKQVITEQSDNDATDIAAEVIKDLLAQSDKMADKPVPAQLQPLRDRFKSLFNKADQERIDNAESFYIKAGAIAERLLDNQRNLRVLHGDIHHENIMLSKRGWLVIDPKGLYGDMGFDTANMFYNPLHQIDLTADPSRIGKMAECFATALNQTPRHILDYAVSYGALSASWHAEDGSIEDEENALRVAAAIMHSRNHFF